MRSSRLLLLTAALGLLACGDDPAGPDNDVLDWPTDAPAAQGMDAALLESAAAHIESDLPNVNAFLVARHGVLVLERYFNGTHRSTEHYARSVTKSVTSTMVGAGLLRGWIDSLDQPIWELLPVEAFTDSAAAKRLITVRQLLTMASGLDRDASDSIALGPADDWLFEILQGPTWTAPGGGFRYDSGNPHLLSAILTNQTGFSMADLSLQTLFGPLGVDHYQWPDDPQGLTNGSTGILMTAQDLAKLGQLFLQDGVWRSVRLLPEGWVDLATTPVHDLGGGTGYSFLWWNSENLGSPAFMGIGYREQYLVVLPQLDIVVVILSESITPTGPVVDHSHLVEEFVVPAAG